MKRKPLTSKQKTDRRSDKLIAAAKRDGVYSGLSNTLTRWQNGELIMIPNPSNGGQTQKGK